LKIHLKASLFSTVFVNNHQQLLKHGFLSKEPNKPLTAKMPVLQKDRLLA